MANRRLDDGAGQDPRPGRNAVSNSRWITLSKRLAPGQTFAGFEGVAEGIAFTAADSGDENHSAVTLANFAASVPNPLFA